MNPFETSESDHRNLSKDIFDQEILMERLSDDYDAVKEVLQIFVDDVKQRIDGMAGSIQSGDLNSIVSEAHTIKGSSATIGAWRCQKAAESLEHAAAGINEQDIHSKYVTLKICYSQLSDLLRAEKLAR